MSQVFDESGTAFPIEAELARGGQGIVCKLRAMNSHLVKIWHTAPSQGDRRRSEALRQLACALSDVAALPVSLAFHDAGRTRHCGVFIPLAEGLEVFEIYNAASRRALLPGATFELLVRTARQTAQAFARIHAHGLVVGDVNEKNLKVMPGSGVRLIDTDSFQVHDGQKLHTSDVGTPLWTPPELQGLRLTGLKRTANHDLFGLAQMIFLLLFSGRHPFAGVPRRAADLQPHEAIRQHAFAYAPAHLGLPLAPPRAAPPLAMLPERIQQAFLEAFLPASSRPGARPSAQHWVQLLAELEQGLKRCPASPSHLYWQGAKSCPWCDIFQQTGADLFPRTTYAEAPGSNDPAAEALRSLQPYAFQITPDAAIATHVQVPLPPEPKNLMAWCSRLLFRQQWQKTWQSEQLRRHKSLIRELSEKIRRMQQEQRQLIKKYQRDFLQHKKDLQHRLSSRPSNAELRAQCVEAVLQGHQQGLLEQHLGGISIRGHKIPLVGEARMAKLNRARIFTAADLQPQKLQAAGMPSNAIASLIKFRRRMERSCKGSPLANLTAHDHDRVEQMFQQAERDHQRKLAVLREALTSCTQNVHRKMLSTDAAIRRLSLQKAQAEAIFTSLRTTTSL